MARNQQLEDVNKEKRLLMKKFEELEQDTSIVSACMYYTCTVGYYSLGYYSLVS